MNGAEYFLGKFGGNELPAKGKGGKKPTVFPKSGEVPIDDAVEYLESEKTAKLLEPPAAAAELNRQIGSAYDAAVEMFRKGPNPDALVLLVQAKCAWTRNGKQVSDETVRIVLKAIGRLGEYVQR